MCQLILVYSTNNPHSDELRPLTNRCRFCLISSILSYLPSYLKCTISTQNHYSPSLLSPSRSGELLKLWTQGPEICQWPEHSVAGFWVLWTWAPGWPRTHKNLTHIQNLMDHGWYVYDLMSKLYSILLFYNLGPFIQIVLLNSACFDGGYFILMDWCGHNHVINR